MPELSINPGIEMRDAQRELHHFQLRLAIASALVLGLFLMLAARFFYLQVIRHGELHTLAGFDVGDQHSALAGEMARYAAAAALAELVLRFAEAEPQPDVFDLLAGGLDALSAAPAERVGEVAAGAGIVLHELRPQGASLEEVFLELTAEEPE